MEDGMVFIRLREKRGRRYACEAKKTSVDIIAYNPNTQPNQAMPS